MTLSSILRTLRREQRVHYWGVWETIKADLQLEVTSFLNVRYKQCKWAVLVCLLKKREVRKEKILWLRISINVRNVAQLSRVRRIWKGIIVRFIHILPVMSVVKPFAQKMSLRLTTVLCTPKFKRPTHVSLSESSIHQDSETAWMLELFRLYCYNLNAKLGNLSQAGEKSKMKLYGMWLKRLPRRPFLCV